VGDLFSGIGGFSLAAEWMGWRTAWFSEIDPFASRVLAHHWPDVPNLGDITKVDWSTVPRVDVVTGGFPCQPHSLAGQRKGSHDERDLFDEIIRCIGVVRPRFVVLENVPGLFTSESGRFFGRVLGAVAACGYDAEWQVISAADVGAPHLRERVWIVAYAEGVTEREQNHQTGAEPFGRNTRVESAGRRGGFNVRPTSAALAHSNVQRLEGHNERPRPALTSETRFTNSWTSTFGNGRDWWATEPNVGRVADGIPGRMDRLRCLGNSIVPQVAVEIFRRVEVMALSTPTQAAA
jgi:DNA (cytosine-5)-methyltransferase 1